MAGLSITSGGGTQTTTQSPQGLASSGTSAEAATSVQPGTASTLLTTPTGISLGPSQVATVPIASTATASSTKTAAVATVQPKHHTNDILLGGAIALLIIAFAAFYMITRSAKNTTYYD